MPAPARSPARPDPLPPEPVALSAEAWHSLSPAERALFLETSLAALQARADLMSEGSPHHRAKFRARLVLGDYFRRAGRDVYLGSELPVHYPGEPVFAPDLIAIAGVPDPGDSDERMAWVVAEEGRGIDLALEVLHGADPEKDLVTNVSTFARLGIPEYFVYDRRRFQVIGYRLVAPGPRHYRRVTPAGGRVRSEVLGLDIGVEGGRLQFYAPGGAQVLETVELLERLSGMVGEIERRADEAEEARRRAEDDRKRAEDDRKRAEEALAAETAARAELERVVAALRARLGEKDPE